MKLGRVFKNVFVPTTSVGLMPVINSPSLANIIFFKQNACNLWCIMAELYALNYMYSDIK